MGRQTHAHSRRFTFAARALALGMALCTVVGLRPARGAPADIFSIAAPVMGADAPKPTDIKAGDASVATQTGALTYSFGIEVPPGRNGMAPHLALSYSSQAPIYGGVAAGWSLGVPMILEDTSQGRLKTHYPYPFTGWRRGAMEFGDRVTRLERIV